MIRSVPAETVRPLLDWYAVHARTLPWRSIPTPYRVWVSEIMLQQTRVEAVLDYFQRFMAALPTVQALADTDEQTLLKLWEGLGYYSRARNLQKAARIIVEQYGGELPKTAKELQQLPGIGAYTAGAVASIAFGQRVPAVDGNVLRVLSRVTACPDDVTAAGVKEKTAAALQRILPPQAGEFNQALMDLGATVCLPNGVPKCAECPLNGLCAAHREEKETAYPVKAAKKNRRVEQRTVLLALRDGKVALRRRPEDGLLAGLWEFPSLDGERDADRLLTVLTDLGLQPAELRPAVSARHIFTHIEWQMQGWVVQCRGSGPADWVWVTPQELTLRYPVPSAFRAFTKLL